MRQRTVEISSPMSTSASILAPASTPLHQLSALILAQVRLKAYALTFFLFTLHKTSQSYSTRIYDKLPSLIVRMFRPSSQHPMDLTLRGIRCTAVFSEDWDWPFNPKNPRSRRRRFNYSGERVSGFTAVFCDDWKDWEQRSKASADGYGLARPQGSQSRLGHGGCKRKRDVDDLGNCEDANPSSTNSWWQRQREEQGNIERASTPLPPIPPTCHVATDLDEWWSLSPTALEDLVPSFTPSVDDEDAVQRGPATPSCSTPRIADLPCPMPVGMEPQAEEQWSQLLAPDNYFPSLADLVTTCRGSAMPPTEDLAGYGRCLTGGSSFENGGFDYWSELLECNTSLDNWRAIQSRGEMGKSAVEHNSQGMIHWRVESDMS